MEEEKVNCTNKGVDESKIAVLLCEFILMINLKSLILLGGTKSSKKGGSNSNASSDDVIASPAKVASQASTGAISKNIQKS